MNAENVLSFLDQTTFELQRATGRRQLMQCVWIYERPVDLAALREFNRRLGLGILGRRIERSPLPFGRPRWVASPEPAGELELIRTQRPRDEILDWADEQVALPIDPEFGPGWRLGAAEFAGGTTAVSLAVSHCIADGGASALAVIAAVHDGQFGGPAFPPPRSRTRFRALLSDFRQCVRDVPAAARAFSTAVAAVRTSRRAPAPAAAAPTPAPAGTGDRIVSMPSAAVIVPIQDWDAKAKELGGNHYSLSAAFAAKFAERVGRCRVSDGAVTLVIAVNDRTDLEDTRAIAMTFAKAAVDPTTVTTDLGPARTVIKAARANAMVSPDPALELVPLIPWLPRGAVKGVVNALFAYSEDRPVSCSNMGDLPPQGNRIDGTDADYLLIRGADQDVTEREMVRSHGQLVIVSGRINGNVTLSFEAFQPEADNSRSWLRELAGQTLADFGLAGVIF